MRRRSELRTPYGVHIQNKDCPADRVTNNVEIATTPAAKDQRLHRGDVDWEHNIGLRLSSPGRSVVLFVFIWVIFLSGSKR